MFSYSDCIISYILLNTDSSKIPDIFFVWGKKVEKKEKEKEKKPMLYVSTINYKRSGCYGVKCL